MIHQLVTTANRSSNSDTEDTIVDHVKLTYAKIVVMEELVQTNNKCLHNNTVSHNNNMVHLQLTHQVWDHLKWEHHQCIHQDNSHHKDSSMRPHNTESFKVPKRINEKSESNLKDQSANII